jgi:cytochrome c
LKNRGIEKAARVRASAPNVFGLLIFTCVGLLAATANASEQLMEKSGCIACHRVDQPLIGPAFKDIAVRYRDTEGVPEYLFEKVREGGEGVWGDKPMLPNTPQKISDENLRAVITWILSL